MAPDRVLVLLGFTAIGVFLWLRRHEILLRFRFPQSGHGESEEKRQAVSELFPAADILSDFLGGDFSEAPSGSPLAPQDCTMATCFDYSKCSEDRFKVFVYPESEPVSPIYSSILGALRRSHYYTDQPDEACLFVLGLDTIDRDPDRGTNTRYVKNFREKLQLDPAVQQFWNEGRNHIVFNLYAGRWPGYVENDLDFDVGYAILAKASMSMAAFRRGYDVSLPLFHDTLPVRGEDVFSSGKFSRFPETDKKYLLSFKGKRYLYGIGSDSRNFLYHIHNNHDIIILTTCKHGKDTRIARDSRCDQDDVEYNRYDYQMLLTNSTFCLVPRGRRLGSFRFLEALQAGCIPVSLSNGWELPFSEIINWNKAVLVSDERLLTQIPTLVRSIEFDRILAMRQQSQLLWRQYFSSIERIVLTTLEIVRNRLGMLRRSREVWNQWPAMAMSLVPYVKQSDLLADFCQNVRNPGSYEGQNFTALITLTQKHNLGTLFVRLLKTLNRLPYVEKVIVITPWRTATIQAIKSWTWIRVPITTTPSNSSAVEMMALIDGHIPTNCLTLLTDECDSTWEEFEFGFHIWKRNPERLVGFRSASHFWDEPTGAWKYSSKLTNDYSMVGSRDAFLHVQYYRLLWHYRGKVAADLPAGCSDVLLNFIVASVTRAPPMKVAGKRNDVCLQTETAFDTCLVSYHTWNGCMNKLVEDVFGYMPLVRSSVAWNPVLYQDNVSSYRKKYRHLEKP
ncbi:Exostosin-1 [Hypsibius exemplaris]|uniref:Exostosin-1 n=1 Tax=Hypsibius exemplaris TaxID=2072580 RepID=A0A9X6NBU2_HYPEX|nr:Exostosin-1 [Hypsibius exemplaris]